MQNFTKLLISSSILLAPAFARAEEEPKPPVSDRPASEPRPEREGEVAPGFQFEGGVASTHVSHGVAKYATKTTPSTEDLALFRVRGIGPGTFAAGSAFSAALADGSTQPKSSPEYVPQAIYGGRLGVVDAALGFQIKLQPRAAIVDNAYEGIARFSVPNRFVTPTLELYPEFVQKRGVYAIAGAEHDVALTRWFTVKPRASFGEQGYEDKSERLHAQDVTLSMLFKARLDETFYAAVKPAWAYLVGPDHYYADPTIGGRSLAYASLVVGAQR